MQQLPAAPGNGRKASAKRVLIGLTLAALLGGVFYLYSNPQLVIMLTDQLWACF